MAKFRLIKTLWGIDDPISPSLFKSIKEEGYHGVEVIRLAWHMDGNDDGKNLVESLNHSGLAVVCQIHTTGGFLRNGEYIYCDEYDVDAHKKDFKKQLIECDNLIQRVQAGGFVNVHGGVDAWSLDEAIEFLTYCLKEIKETVDFQVTFETHRQRLFGNPFQTRELLSNKNLGTLKLNADLSHWYCACERVFDPEEGRDAEWWPNLVQQISQRCHYIHARLGWAQGPQMADPSAPECRAERERQVEVWKVLLSSMQNREASCCCYLSPEYGPPPYMPVLPNSQQPVASLPDAVSYTKKLLEGILDN
eukprot:CAMPEP_0194179724 /NCGR_PEP_ID=MMETSP0154-20130528/13133_1 /TAXON_ID=1049557 /ORGANISM="Thalassiothrix antarctica, Strain L6-D1" /LENGTH=305 /DNA_ID=CAMNT_0038895175 /DNA_START=20 /DNA_END=937 /DNA_ORIENTATION=-